MFRGIKSEGKQKTLAGGGYVYHLDCGNGITGICICPNSLDSVHDLCAVFAFKNCISVYKTRGKGSGGSKACLSVVGRVIIWV